MPFLSEKSTFVSFDQELVTSALKFDCENEDLNGFFREDCLNYIEQLLGKTYCFTLNEYPEEIISFFTVSNDSVKASLMPSGAKNRVRKKVPREKQMANYPAVMIGRLGVDTKFRGLGIGTEMMEFIKYWFFDSKNKTGCRFVLVDSYNTLKTLNFYETKCSFKKVFSNEQQEREYTNDSREGSLKTRLLYFDLIVLSK